MSVLEGIQAIVAAAKREDMDEQQTAVLLATGYVESGWNARAIGDGGDSFGLFQANVNGAAAGVSNPRAFLTPSVAASEAAARFKAAGVKSGAGAVATQRPLESLRAGYARDVDRIASAIIAGTFGPLNRATGAKAPKRGRVTGDTSGLNPNLMDALAFTAGELGKTINVVSGKRSRAEQEQLYQDYLAGKGNLAAKPGTSRHETGNAADAYIDGTALQSYAGAAAAAAKYGLGFPVGGEPWHVELTGAPLAGSSLLGSSASGDAGLVRTSLAGDAASWTIKAVVVLVGLALAAGLVFAGVTKLTGTEQLAGAIVRGGK